MRGRREARLTYSEKLKDPRWQRKRLEIMGAADFKCEGCGAEDKTLHVHHGLYEKNFEPWEYDDSTLWCLCVDCHAEAEEFRQAAYAELARINPLKVGPHKIIRGAFDRGESARKGDSIRAFPNPFDDSYEAQQAVWGREEVPS